MFSEALGRISAEGGWIWRWASHQSIDDTESHESIWDEVGGERVDGEEKKEGQLIF